jgi:YesN/AraC family two-component response regulator
MDPSLSLTSIADRFKITPQYVSMVFKRQKSENIKDFISKVKLDKAKELLTDSSMTMADIAQKLGYANELGVFRLFKKYEGITPGAYKKNSGLE